jgi:hypothetical protein
LEVIRYFVVLANGLPVAYYNTEIHSLETIPTDSEEITFEQWQLFLKKPHKRVNGEWKEIPPLTPEELAEIERNRPRTKEELLQMEVDELKLAIADIYVNGVGF